MKPAIKTTLGALLAGASSAIAQQPLSPEKSFKFPDFGFMLPSSDYHGPVFQLSADYPATLPPIEPEVQKILEIPFEKNWKEYAIAVRDYIFKNNINLANNEFSFNFSGEQRKRWFHVPWQHWGSTGREGFHGLTQEGPLAAKSLAPTQTTASHAYAVGFYNAQGGFAIGQTWKNFEMPDLSYVSSKGFPAGTVVGKFLFTTLGENEVPQLVNPVQWNAYVYENDIPGGQNAAKTARKQTKVNLLQMDIMVKDWRAKNANGWVFGTFAYNGNLKKENPWENLQPVGLMWGNDPHITLSQSNPTPTKTIINKELRETVINDDPSLPAQHLGWNSRLNGPADNPNSSCMSCHSTAQYPAVSSILPFLNQPPVSIPPDGTEAPPAWMRWFRNFQSNVAFDPGKASTTDFSLQLSKSIQNFVDFRSETEKGFYAGQYWSNGQKIHSISRGAPH